MKVIFDEQAQKYFDSTHAKDSYIKWHHLATIFKDACRDSANLREDIFIYFDGVNFHDKMPAPFNTTVGIIRYASKEVILNYTLFDNETKLELEDKLTRIYQQAIARALGLTKI